MEPSLPQSHQFSLQTKSKSRGSVALLSVIWLATTGAGMSAIARATVVVHQRAEVQTDADVIALAAADYGNNTARQLASSLHVEVMSLTRTSNTVTVVVKAHRRIATATAIQPM